jgi:hypothetical protein
MEMDFSSLSYNCPEFKPAPPNTRFHLAPLRFAA